MPFGAWFDAAVAGIGLWIIVYAARISYWERRLLDRHPWTRVTGWSGMRKGIFTWRLIGAALLLLGIVGIALFGFDA